MNKPATPRNEAIFLASTFVAGAVAGAFVWGFFKLMNAGLSFLWESLPAIVAPLIAQAIPGMDKGAFDFLPFPLIVCLIGGVVIGLYEKHVGFAPEELPRVIGSVKKNGRYPYDHLGKRSLAALLPLLFGGSVGPEAGLTGVIAGLCTWVGDRTRALGADIRLMTVTGTQAALTAIFAAPLYGFAAPLTDEANDDGEGAGSPRRMASRKQKALVYFIAVVGALGAFVALGDLFGQGGGLPRFDEAHIGASELTWLVPLVLLGTLCGWCYLAANTLSGKISKAMKKHPIAKAVIAGGVLGGIGCLLPYVMFAGEHQTKLLMEAYLGIPALVLIATAFAKAAITPLCINLGWKGGHFFPLIFCGVSLGYGIAIMTGADAVFCVAICTAAVMGSVMRNVIMTTLLLVMCFPLKGVVAMMCATFIASSIPLPRALKPNEDKTDERMEQ